MQKIIGRGSAINPANLQEHLDSAANAALKGQAQYFTPVEWAEVLSLALPRYRPVIVDLTCGNGQLLDASTGPSTHHLLGLDIEVHGNAMFNEKRVTADLTKFYPLLCAVKWQADLFVLNAPWDLHWYRDKLIGLADSDCPAVRDAFGQHDGRTGRAMIDSTVATFCIALDRCSPFGEGLIIANEATLQRLIFGNGGRAQAPHSSLASHVWAHLVIDGNICSPAKPDGRSGTEFKTGIIYFARGHTSGCKFEQHIVSDDALAAAKAICLELFDERLMLRKGSEIKPTQGFHMTDTADLWLAARKEWMALRAANGGPHASGWNIFLDVDGTLKTDLSVFDTASGRVDKQAADRLNNLNGKHPMQLILQVAQRKELMKLTVGENGGSTGTVWRVAPAVTAAVAAALSEYELIRSPLTALSPVQRLGYLDENDDIICEKDLWKDKGVAFVAGVRYKIRTETLQVKRSGEKMNLQGELDQVEWEGSELAIYITDGSDVERLFMEGRLRDDKQVKLSGQNADETASDKIDFTLQDLVGHFKIPEVPDVAAVRPEEYQRNLKLLEEIEQLA
jgi:hypothetical protein